MTAEWPVVRQDWTGHIPKIHGNRSTADIFQLACRPSGATIKDMLRLRRDMGNDDYKKESALLKLIYAIEKAYLVELIVNGDNYRFQRVNTNASSPSIASQQTHSQPQDNSHQPTREEVEKILREIAPKGKEIDEELLKRRIEFAFALEKRTLKAGWWERTKINLVEWSKKG